MTEREKFEAYFEKRLAEPPLSLWEFWKMGTRKTHAVEPQCGGVSAEEGCIKMGEVKGKQMTERERFERYQAAKIGMDYEEIKCRFDEYERTVGERYGKNGQFAKEWEVWSAAVPEGFVVVPIVPTGAMLVAARDWSVKKYGQAVGNDGASGCYKAMIAAAQENK